MGTERPLEGWKDLLGTTEAEIEFMDRGTRYFDKCFNCQQEKMCVEFTSHCYCSLNCYKEDFDK